MQQPRLSVVIVNYNVRYFLEQALLSVRRASSGLNVEIFVVDNNSVDDSVDMVRQKFPEVIVLANDRNLGFSTANNQAIRQANGEYVLLLNPDTVIEEDTFRKCLDFMDAHPEAGGLGVRMIDGGGNFLPESKRGFPNPLVAFYKAFGLSRLFPKSRVFNRYHLGYLDPGQTHRVDVLSGAFMWLRKKVLDEIGLLDEAFFMYGEDIDLSYRIVQAGYQNYYFADTTIIHYKGESTKKGSLNYVRTFYQAMIIFTRKHFEGGSAWLFVAMLRLAIYFRAALTLVHHWTRSGFFLVADAVALFAGLFLFKNVWAEQYHHNPDYYPPSVGYFNIPLHVLLWLGAVFLSGGYDEPFNLRRLSRGLLAGTLLNAAVYGLLPLYFRPSRALWLFGAIWAIFAAFSIRTLLHLIRYGNIRVGRTRPQNLAIVGSLEESERTQFLLRRAGVEKNLIGTVSPLENPDTTAYLSGLSKLEEVVRIFQVQEIIFCGGDISSQDIMRWMTRLGPQLEYRILPTDGLSIIGSSSKNTAGELYTVEIKFGIATAVSRRNKRLFDFLSASLLLVLSPLLGWAIKPAKGFFRNLWLVWIGRKTWVGYALPETGLPALKPGVLHPGDTAVNVALDSPTLQRLDFFYAKDYDWVRDLELIWKGFSKLGRHEQG